MIMPSTWSVDSFSALSALIVGCRMVDSVMCVKVLQCIEGCIGESAPSDSTFKVNTAAVFA